MATIRIKKETVGVTFQKDAEDIITLFGQPDRVLQSGTSIIIVHKGERISFSTADSLIVNDVSFTGTSDQKVAKLRNEVFFLKEVANNENIQTLKALARRARNDNPRTKGIATDQPTISTQIGTPTGLTNSFLHVSKPNLFTFHGGRVRIINSNFYIVAATTDNLGGTGGNVGIGESQHVSRVSFMVDSAKFSLRVCGRTTVVAYRIIVDGQYLSLTGQTTADASIFNQNHIILDYTGTTGRKVRHVVLEMERIGSFEGVHVGPTDNVFAASDNNFRMMMMGDSWLAATGTTRIGDNFGRVFADYLGVQNAWHSAIGGTGYIANATSYTTALQRLGPDVTTQSPNALCTFMGINDNPGAPLQAAVDTYIRDFRAACPGVPHFVFGNWAGATGPNQANIDKENNIKAAVTAFADPLTFFIPVTTDANGAWQYGTGRPGALASNGNSDYYAFDMSHVNTAGHEYIGRRAADAIINLINKL